METWLLPCGRAGCEVGHYLAKAGGSPYRPEHRGSEPRQFIDANMRAVDLDESLRDAEREHEQASQRAATALSQLDQTRATVARYDDRSARNRSVTTTPLDEFEPAVSWNVAALGTANHESAHAVAAVLFDVKVIEVRIDRPGVDGSLGWCATVKHADKWRSAAVAIAPHAVAGTAGATPDLLSDDSDIWHAAQYFYDSGRLAADWPAFIEMVRELLLLLASRAALRVVSGALLEHGALRGDDVHRLVAAEAAIG